MAHRRGCPGDDQRSRAGYGKHRRSLGTGPDQIAAAGDGGSTNGNLKIIPVIGGTGAYDGAHGDVVITNASGSTSAVVFHLLGAAH